MQRSSEAAARILEIEAQQDEVLRQLDELERRTAAVLAEHAPAASRPDLLAAAQLPPELKLVAEPEAA
jgi:hypothetical protein